MEYPKQVRCIRSVSSCYTVGKIYNVNEDGYVIDKDGYGVTHLNLTTKFNCDGETFLGNSDFEEVKEETKEATTSGSVGAYETPAFLAKSTKKKDFRGASKPLYKGGAFVSVKKKCTKFPYCNAGDINALDIYKNESLNKAIKNISESYGLKESTIKAILEYEFEKLNNKDIYK